MSRNESSRRDTEYHGGDGSLLRHLLECDQCYIETPEDQERLRTYRCWSCDKSHENDKVVRVVVCNDGYRIGRFTLCPECYDTVVRLKTPQHMRSAIDQFVATVKKIRDIQQGKTDEL